MSAEGTAANRASWNVATQNHNRHKGDQAAFLREGGDTLFPEELELLGDLRGRRVVHLQCNAGQDTLSLVHHGAVVTGIDLSDEAVAFATKLSEDSGLPGTFVRHEVVDWMETTSERFEVAFASYGALPWNADLDRWMAGAARVLAPGGRLVVVEFHPLAWSLGDRLDLSGDSYFHKGPYREPVGDYVAQVTPGAVAGTNAVPACAWQHTVADTLTAVVGAGLRLNAVHEWPYSNYARLMADMVQDGRRWRMPADKPEVPLMVGFVATRGA